MFNILSRAILALLGAALTLFFANANANAAVVTTFVHSFKGTSQSDGSIPIGGLIQAGDGNFYGTTSTGGNGNDFGTVFTLSVTGQGVSTAVLYSFSGGDSDGSYPDAGLIQGSDGNFYGTTSGDTASYSGTVYRITPAGQLTTLHGFGGSDGSHPQGQLVEANDGNFYGTTSDGGAANAGTVFKITPDGALTTLYSFAGGNNGNADGGYPQSGVIQASDGFLYGTTLSGGMANCGTVFKIGIDGQNYTRLYTFTCGTGPGQDQGMPVGALVEGADQRLYGTTSGIGLGTDGTVFAIAPAGQLSTLHAFDGSNGEGSTPRGSLLLGSDGFFYGTTPVGNDSLNSGTVFKVDALGNLTVLYGFAANGGASSNSQSGLVQGSDGNLYGVTANAGASGLGSAFRIVPTPLLPIPISMTLSTNPITAGQSTTLSWHLAVPTGGSSSQCFAGGDWSGSPATGGQQTLTPTQAGPYTYTLTCGGVESASATLHVSPLAAPSNVVAQVGDGQVTLSWTAVDAATGYAVNYQDTNLNIKSTVTVNGGGTTSTPIAGLNNGTLYLFTVASFNDGGATSSPAPQPALHVTLPPAAPTGVIASPRNAQVVLTWDGAAGASSYNIYAGTAAGGESLVASGVGTNTYAAGTLSNGTTYYFKVAAVNAGGTGALSAEVSATPMLPPAKPTGVTASSGDTEVLVTWTQVAGADSYTLSYRLSGNSSVTPQSVQGITGTSYLVTGLVNDTSYSFWVTAVNAGGASPQSDLVTKSPTALPSAPDGVTVLPKNAKVVLSWNQVLGAGQYNVFVGTSPGGEDLSQPITTSATTYTATSLTNGTPYYFTVRAVNRNGSGAYSAEVSATPVAPPAVAPDGFTASPDDGKVALNWNAVAGADGYAIYQGTTSDDAMIVASVTGTSTTITGLANGTTYYFKVAATNAGGSGPLSAAVKAVPAVPSQSSSGGGAFGPGILSLLGASVLLRRRRWTSAVRFRARVGH